MSNVLDTWGDPDRTFELLPEGFYDVRVNSYETREASTGTPQVMIKGETIASDSGQKIGRNATIFLSLHTKMVGVLRLFLEAAGIDYERITGPQGGGIRWDADHLNGIVIRGQVAHRINKNTQQLNEQWQNWQPSKFQPQAAPGQAAPEAQSQAQPQAAPAPEPQGAVPPRAQPQG